MKRLLFAMLVSSACWTTNVEKPRVARATLVPMEKSFNRRMEAFNVEDPFYLLGTTRGIYLDGYGAVFTNEINLVLGPNITPFSQIISKEQIARLRQKKLARLPKLREVMRDMLVDAAASLDTVPPEEHVVVGVTLFHFSWEDTAGLPAQIIMKAPRRALLDYKTRRLDSAGLDAAVRIQEL
jgi:hypothetical protein